MWTLTQLSPKTKTVGTFETFAELNALIKELAGSCEIHSAGSARSEAVYFSFSDDREYEAYNHD